MRRDLLQFDELADWFLQRGAMVSPAELHGLLCGQIAGGRRPTAPSWLHQCEEFLGLGVTEEEAEAVTLTGFLETVCEQFHDQNFGLRLLLPDDDSELAERVGALAQWCQGFLEGVAIAGQDEDVPAWEALTDESREALTDMAEIARARVDGDIDDGERDYAEVSEYVRTVALHLHLELSNEQPPPAAQPGSATTHSMAGLFGGDDRRLH